MIIVSDTTPLHYLILIEREEILPALFGEIIIPEAVLAEMRHENTPAAVRRWIDSPPVWVQIKTASQKFPATIGGLGKGETEAIALAIEEKADAVLMDDRKAIREARRNNLTVLTTLAILELAAIKNLIDLPQVLDELAQTSFRLPNEDIIEEF
jgi:predicted nucleic acid-binding protein